MEKIRMILWLPFELQQKFKHKCKVEGVTMQRKFYELVKEYLKN